MPVVGLMTVNHAPLLVDMATADVVGALMLRQVGYQPEPYLGFTDHDQNYLAWQVFGEMFMNDTAVR